MSQVQSKGSLLCEKMAFAHPLGFLCSTRVPGENRLEQGCPCRSHGKRSQNPKFHKNPNTARLGIFFPQSMYQVLRLGNVPIFNTTEVLKKPQYYIPSPNTKTLILKYHKYWLYCSGQYSKIQGWIIKINCVCSLRSWVKIFSFPLTKYSFLFSCD